MYQPGSVSKRVCGNIGHLASPIETAGGGRDEGGELRLEDDQGQECEDDTRGTEIEQRESYSPIDVSNDFDASALNPTSVLAKEINYLQSHGYQWSADLTKLTLQK